MHSVAYPHKIVLLSSGFQYPERHLFFARARLYFDRIELTGWQVHERHEAVIPLDSVAGLEWQWEGEDATLSVLREDDEPVRLRLPQGQDWRQALEMRMNWRTKTRTAPAADRVPQSLRDVIAYSTSMS